MKEKTADEIKIKLKDIAKLQHLYIEIFTEEVGTIQIIRSNQFVTD